MVSTLLLRLQAPLQAWGLSSLFPLRDTAREPTRSGVIGLVCAALGLKKSTDLKIFSSLRMGVRVDQEGIMMKDFQTARGVLKATGKGLGNVISNRYYLSDAVFLVGLESDQKQFLDQINSALKHPRWLLFLGRRAFPPSKPVWLHHSIRDESLEVSLATFPWLINNPEVQKNNNGFPQTLRVVIENDKAENSRMDIPLDFKNRVFTQRWVHTSHVPVPREFYQEVENGHTLSE